MRSTLLHIVRPALLITLLLLVVGCSWLPWKGDAGKDGVIKDDGSVWQPGPVAMRFYAATRLAQHDTGPVIEARVEFVDALGDTTKGVGRFHFELSPIEHQGQTDIGQRLYTWDTEALTLTQQREHFDAITGTYYFRLSLDAASAVGQKLRLAATFAPVEGPRLEAEMTLGE